MQISIRFINCLLQEACEYTNTHLSPIKIIQFQSSKVAVAGNQL
jgi:hypothetical protein